MKTLVRSNWPIVPKSGVAVNVAGSFWTPTAIATTVVTRMLISSAAGTCRAHRAIVRTRPNQNTKCAGSVGKTNVTGTGFSADVPPVLTMIPASMNPMNRMNRPMPTPIARLSDSGTARMTASRRPTRTSSVTRRPSRTMTPIAPAGRQATGQDEAEGHGAVDPEPGGEGDRGVGEDAHRDRHDAGDERRRGRGRRDGDLPRSTG